MHIIRYRKIYYILSIAITVAALACVAIFGIRFGLDFTGGSSIEYTFEGEVPASQEVRAHLADVDFLGEYLIKNIGEDGIAVRTQTITEEQKQIVTDKLQGVYSVEESQFSTVGPSLGNELRTKAVVSLLVAIILIMFFIAFAFRHVSKPVPSWKYGVITVIALFHDIIMPLGAFALMGHFMGVEVDTLFVIALLVVVGYSINDTIVVFDRIRENLSRISDDKKRSNDFEKIVGKSLSETIARSINTSLTTMIALIALYFFGGEVTQPFALALIVGVFAGTYSSIFLASPLLISMKSKGNKKAE